MMRFGHNVCISDNAIIGKNVRIARNSIVFDNVEIGDNSTICENCIIGEPTAASYTNASYVNEKTLIGQNALIRSGTVIYSGSQFGEGLVTGHLVTIRERTVMGRNCLVGTHSDIQGDVFFGDYCRLYSKVHIAQKSKIGNFVFIYPCVTFTNDPKPPSQIISGCVIGDYVQVAAGATILPRITIGTHSVIGANSLVNRNYPDYSLVLGNPSKRISDVRKMPTLEKSGSHYPWPYNFDRGMPWEGMNYDEWLNSEEGLYYHDK